MTWLSPGQTVQASGEGAEGEPPSSDSHEEDEMEYDSKSGSALSVGVLSQNGDMYKLDEIN